MGPVEKIANRLLRKRSLVPPINVEALVQERASLAYKWFPFSGISGLCLHMKGGPEKAKVIIEASLGLTRKRFTLAHELGHLVIPWHVGSTFDTIDLAPSEAFAVGEEYYQIENEANLFAAELLMPTQWVMAKAMEHADLAELHKTVTIGAQVSPIAAAIRLMTFLPAGVVWVIEQGGVIRHQGMTFGTSVPGIWNKGQTYSDKMYSYAHAHYLWESGSNIIHWWELPSEVPVYEDDARSWQDILEGIVADLGYEDPEYQKQSFNGIIGAMNGKLKQQAQVDITLIHSAEALAALCIQRFADSEHTAFFEHPDAILYIKKRAKGIFEKSRK